MDRARLTRWVEGYERAWRTSGTAPLRALFTYDATYQAAPFDEPIDGIEAIAAFWEAERDSPDEVFTMTWSPVAIDGDVGVARVEVRYGEPVTKSYRDLWVVTLDGRGRCRAFEEWPFFPGQPRVA